MNSTHKGTILVVDDTPANLGVLFEALRQANFKVLIAEDGVSALKRFDYALPDVILLDVQMPDMDGFEVYRRLKSLDSFADVPVIFLSVVSEPLEIVRAFGLDAVDYVTKPFDPAEVVARVEKHLTMRNLQKSLEERNAQLQQEITERKRVEEQLKTALTEKDVLLDEVYHRVKNNLSMLISLINLQAKTADTPATAQMFYEFRGRVEAMNLIHQKLYQSNDVGQINFGDFLRELIADLVYAQHVDRRIMWRVEAKNIFVNVSKAIPCSLIANELVTNVLKYAFPPDWPAATGKSEMHVAFGLTAEGYILTVSDNGVGLPPGLDWQNSTTLGLHLVQLLAVQQLKGSIEVEDARPGVTFKVKIPGITV